MNINHPEAQIADSDPTVCFIALPFGDKAEFPYESVLLPALRMVLELDPYYWRVGRADDERYKSFIYDNIGEWLKCAHVYIADISDLNYNVMMEFGYMHWMKKPGQPLIVLEREASKATLPEYKDLADIQGLIRTRYQIDSSLLQSSKLTEYAIHQLTEHFRNIFRDDSEIQQMRKIPRQHYLSPLWIESECHYPKKIGRIISKEYVTMEAFKDAVTGSTGNIDAKRVKVAAEKLSSWGIDEGIIKGILDRVKNVLKGGRG